MKTHFIIAGCLGLVMWSVAAQGQNFVWAKGFGGTGDGQGKSIAVDAAGNVHVMGYFNNGTADFDPGPGTYNLNSDFYGDVFIVKLDAAGNLIWAKKFDGNSEDRGLALALDNAGNVYATGYFHGTADFDPGAGTFNLTSAGKDLFILKLDASGNLAWAKGIGGNSSDSGNSIAVDASGNVYVTGDFRNTVDFDPGPDTFNITSSGVEEAFVTKLDTDGNFLWAIKLGGLDADHGYSIDVDVVGNVYAAYTYYSFGTTSTIIKLDASGGSTIWSKTIGGSGDAYITDMDISANGKINITGYFSGTRDFDPGPGIFTLASAASFDIFIVNLDLAGNFIWAKKCGGIDTDYGYSIGADLAGNVYATGMFRDTSDFDPGAATHNLISAGSQDIFIIKLDGSGNLVQASQVGSLDGEIGYSIAVDVSGNVFTTGHFSNTVDFDPSLATFNLTSAGSTDAFVMKMSNTSPYVVNGNIFGDVSGNCTRDTSVDVSLPGVLVKVEPGPIYGMSNLEGNYSVNIFDTGSYTISIATQDTLWQPSCTSPYNVQVTIIPDTTSNNDFAMTATHYCSRLTVELGTPRLRRCFNNTYTIRYANTGTFPASNAYMEVEFGEHLQPQSSTLPWSSASGNIYTFQLGNIAINQQGSFRVTALLSCNAPLGSTQCVTSHIYPDSVCAAPSTGWDKSETKVKGTCVNDSLVCFVIKNRSSPPAGNMQGTAPWRLFVNDALVTQGNYQLAGQDSLIQCYPANGKTYRLEADQRLGHPGNSHPQAIIEACGNGPVDFGFVNTVAQDDADLFVETFCMEVIGSFDPNDKQVFPTGITASKYIKPDSELEYLIRFQNTGNDTAFKVVIRDTIQTDVIDIATLTSGASSHDYTFNIYGHGIAEWTFNNILLPDSNVNEPESHGFVKFKAKLLPNISPGTIVTNSADIYFDFNVPVITNEVWNTVFDTVLRAPVTISGTVLTEINQPVAGVTVKLIGSATDSIVTAADGRYDFEVEPGGSYTITPSKNNDVIPANGLTTYDILTMRRHLLGMAALPSPYKIISASEVNAEADTSVTTQDIVLIRSLILGNTTRFPSNRLWQFVSSDYMFSDLSHPFPFNKTRTYTNLISSQTNQNFIGIKLGDVNESWDGN